MGTDCDRPSTNSLQIKQTACSFEVLTKAAFDFEKQPVLTFAVAATDSGGRKAARQFSLAIRDLNEPPSAILLNGAAVSSVTAAEEVPGLRIAAVTAEDPDAGDKPSVRIASDPSGLLNLEAGGSLRVKAGAKLDFEALPEFNLTLEARDTGSPAKSLSRTILLKVQNKNEAPNRVVIR